MTLTSGLTEKAKEELMRKYAEIQMKQAQTLGAHTNTSIQPGAFYPTTTLPFPNVPIVADPPIKLDEGAWDIPVSQLVDLWTVRYGSKWVDESELDEFYKVASQRLRTLNKVESHFVNGKDVFRIVE